MYIDPETGISVSSNGSPAAESFISTFQAISNASNKLKQTQKGTIYAKYGFVYFVNPDVWSGYSASDHPGYPSREYDGGIWLIRKDQLIELSGKGWQEFNFQIARDPYRLETSEERAGLSYIMMKKYNKKWDGEKWI